MPSENRFQTAFLVCMKQLGKPRYGILSLEMGKGSILCCFLYARELERCGYTEAVLVKLFSVCFGFGSIRDKFGRLADCAVEVVWVKLYAETAGQLFAHIQTSADEPAFGV